MMELNLKMMEKMMELNLKPALFASSFLIDNGLLSVFSSQSDVHQAKKFLISLCKEKGG